MKFRNLMCFIMLIVFFFLLFMLQLGVKDYAGFSNSPTIPYYLTSADR